MRNPLVATRYAKALIDLAVETNQLDAIKKDVDFLRLVQTAELRAMLSSPIIRGEKKSKIFSAIFHGKVTELKQHRGQDDRSWLLPHVVLLEPGHQARTAIRWA